jgi:uncharacterized phage-like protein YoqJ
MTRASAANNNATADNFAALRTVTVAFTGYRPPKIRRTLGEGDIEAAVRFAAREAIVRLYGDGYRIFLSGMAEGFDLWAAHEALLLREGGECPELSLTAVVPFTGQERRFEHGQAELYRRALEGADRVVVLSPDYTRDCYARRNDWLVDNAALVACWFDGQRGGTQYTVRRARKAGVPVVNLLEKELF